MQPTHNTLSENIHGQSVDAIAQAAGYADSGTAALLTEVSCGIDHQVWFVESHRPPQ